MQARAKQAHFWLVLDVLGRQGIPFLVSLVIARIIDPEPGWKSTTHAVVPRDCS